MNLSITERRSASNNIKKETQKYYNYKIKEYLVIDY